MDTFYYKLFLSVLVGGFYISITSYLAEKLGSTIGGIISSFPSVIVISLLFIGITESPEAVTKATDAVPLSLAFYAFFLIAWAGLICRGLLIGLVGSLSLWFLPAYLVSIIGSFNYTFAIGFFFFSLVVSYIIFEQKFELVNCGPGEISLTPTQLLIRAVFSGSMIGLAVYLNKVSGPIWGGLFAAFPAASLSTLVIGYFSRSPRFSRSLTKLMLVSGMLNVLLYSVVVRYSYPKLGLALGTILAFTCAAILAQLIHRVFRGS